MLTILIAAILISLIFAPLGCVVLWKRYIYFGDGLSHASLLAGTLSIVSNLPLIYCGLLISIIFAAAIFKLKSQSESNAVINLVASSMLAISIVISYYYPSRININYLLFGDIISAQQIDLFLLFSILVMVIAFIGHNYRALILIALNKDLAKVQGIRVDLIEFTFLIILALAVFASQKIIGTLLATSLLLVPAMTAQLIAKSPLQMMIIATILAISSNILGLIISYYLDMPIAPIIILVGVINYGLFSLKFQKVR